MIELPIWQVDAFTSRAFHGNPAAVVPLRGAWLDDDLMQSIALENNLSETAFLLPAKDAGCEGDYAIRWFTPVREVALCGHATLASAHTLIEHMGFTGGAVRFHSPRSGPLGVSRGEEGRLVLDFPQIAITPAEVTGPLVTALGRRPVELYAGEKYLAVFENKRDVHELSPDMRALASLPATGIICTAPGAGHDFVSRFFAPAAGVDEDPVTGSAHCVLAPYWAKRLGKKHLTAHQVSKRGGELACEVTDTGRVKIAGHAVTFLEGKIRVPS
ncbi:MAG: PhzF family phenazine biosynthesis protein [Phycisphaerales bacterium]|jgi:PhzF family phenazine biosynthesis protein|nr:PhzF family phenazine biosynthesis protein [Phycisphaerales bacterium]